MSDVTEDQIKAFEDRMRKLNEKKANEERERAERLVADYLRRTGRKELKP